MFENRHGRHVRLFAGDEVVVACGASREAARLGEAMATGWWLRPGVGVAVKRPPLASPGERSAELEVVIEQIQPGRYELVVAGPRVEHGVSVVAAG
jgi:hypothetical protein